LRLFVGVHHYAFLVASANINNDICLCFLSGTLL